LLFRSSISCIQYHLCSLEAFGSGLLSFTELLSDAKEHIEVFKVLQVDGIKQLHLLSRLLSSKHLLQLLSSFDSDLALSSWSSILSKTLFNDPSFLFMRCPKRFIRQTLLSKYLSPDHLVHALRWLTPCRTRSVHRPCVCMGMKARSVKSPFPLSGCWFRRKRVVTHGAVAPNSPPLLTLHVPGAVKRL
jgi:hypothetical protein